MSIVGQDKLLKQLDTYTLDTFPRTAMFVGDYGAGKHLICKMLSEKFNLPLIDISDNINLETLDNICLSTNVNMYLIDASMITEKEQNIILKFLEEPLKNAYIVLLVNNKNRLLPTVTNRCKVFELAKYTKETLSSFIEIDESNKYILDIANTPGEILNLKDSKLSDTVALSDKIINCIHKATFANTLTLLDKVSFRARKNAVVENDTSKIDAFLLTKIIIRKLISNCINNCDPWLFDCYNLTLDLSKKLDNSLQNLGIDQKYLFAQYLSEMWTHSRKYNNGK